MENAAMTSTRLFEPGYIVITNSALAVLNQEDAANALFRHLSGDWGELCPSDQMANTRAVNNDMRILSAYKDSSDTKFWIITEADRSYTTVLLPSDY